mmetsp:Transcript_30001/g.95877  ORF Transcript_30001/g.95877 Transcript_30001/m.95877 type:complete len:629 (-) Transcript_30001:233-2119(-)
MSETVTPTPPQAPEEGNDPTPPQPEPESSEEEYDEGGEYQGPRCVLEDYTKCSESHLWKLMMSFYDRKGPDSWAQGIVPHFITCNAFIGRSYAQVLHGFIRDSMKPGSKADCPLDPTEPLYIIELGTGSGKFSYFMVKALEEMKDTCDFPWEKIVYVMTDFTEANFNFWRDHPRLKKYFDSGNLEAGIFDAVNDGEIRLTNGTVLGTGSCVNPICVVANYLFDTLCHDIFQVDGGVLKEGLVSVGSKAAEEKDPLEPDIIQRFDNLYKYVPIGTDYYKGEGGDDAHLERILAWYKDYFTQENDHGGASLLVPIGALRAIRQLTSMSGGRAIVISGDKGNNNPEHFRGLGDPHIAVHGSFSVMVNYHAIGAYFTSRGGFALHNPQEEASLKVSCFVLGGDYSDAAGDARPWTGDHLEARDRERADRWPNLKAAFNEHVVSFGPNDFFVMQKSLKEDSSQPSLKSIVALLKLSDFDPDVFWKFRDTILNALNTCGEKLRADLGRGIPRVWDNYYLLDKDKDIAFEIGRFFYGIRNYRDALVYYAQSSTEIGEHHVTFHNMGLCYYSEGKLETSLEYFTKALEISPDYEKANSWKVRVERELAPAAAPTAEAADGGGEATPAAEGDANPLQ